MERTRQISAQNLVYRIADELSERGPEFADAYRDTRKRLEDIVGDLLPGVRAKQIQVYCSAVGLLIERHMGKGERVALTLARRSRLLHERIVANPKAHQLQSVDANRARQARGVKHDMNLSFLSRGIVPWGPGEREKFLELIADPEFQHTRPNLKGKPDLAKCAKYLNDHWHGGQSVRKADKLGSVLRSHRYDTKKRPVSEPLGKT